jgi:glycosyltransferase involved in cell wall biosynthesis
MASPEWFSRKRMMLESAPNRRPMNLMFLLSSMPVGGAETLLVNMVRRLDRNRIQPLIACLKQRDELGEMIANEIPVFEGLIRHKYDISVLAKLKRLFRDRQVDAVVTVGAGDKMFWGRMAAWLHGVPVILSALHSTGWPDGIGRLNRMLTGITDGFIAVARQHAEFQIQHERFPESKVFLIPNGIDTERFQFDAHKRSAWRLRLGIPETAPVVSIVAALRPEKNHGRFLEIAKKVSVQLPGAHFVIAGDGSLKNELMLRAEVLGLSSKVHFLGSVADVVGVLSMSDVFALTSDNEASPVSIMEALSCQRPVVAPDVGSIDETVIPGRTGFLYPAGKIDDAADNWLKLLQAPLAAKRIGLEGRKFVAANCSLQKMTDGYSELVETIYAEKMLPRSTEQERKGIRHFAVRAKPSASNKDSRRFQSA